MDIVNVITLKIHHGGLFKYTGTWGLIYVGGEARTFEVDADELCWFYLEELVQKCGSYRKIDEIYYHLPNTSLEVGLKRVYADKEVLEMAEIACALRGITLFAVHGVDKPEIIPHNTITLGQCSRKKMTPKKRPKKDSPKKNVVPQEVCTPLRSSPRFNSQAQSPTPNPINPIPSPLLSKGPISNSPNPNPINPIPSPLSTKAPIPNSPTPNPINPIPSPFSTKGPISNSPIPSPHSPPPFNAETMDEDDYYTYVDPRPDSPIPFKDLVGDYTSSEASDPGYEPENGVSNNESDSDISLDLEDINAETLEALQQEAVEDLDDETFGVDFELPVGDGGDSSDDELKEARQKKKKTDAELIALAQKVQREAAQAKSGVLPTDHGDERDGYHSDYADSDGPEDSPTEEYEIDGVIKKRFRPVVVGENTDWESFKWMPGQRFPNREAFKNAVVHFAIFQGRNVSIVTSNIKRSQRLEVKCLPGCKFRVYASWDKNSACFMVKSVDGGHCCTRNMEKNKQLKTTWLAKHFLEIFKCKPHWPAKELIDTVKSAFRMVISKHMAYKVKYRAHRLLHGSMKEHYQKVGGYMEMIKQASPNSKMVLVKDDESSPPVFKRLFVCFDGVSKGWKEGCRRVLCIDACFIKTFLGGQLLAAVGRDGNDQMFPVAWAVVEGENNDSWEWFLNEVKHCLELNDGNGVAIISDEHQSILYAVNKVLPSAEHRHCARHIYAHWHKAFRGEEFKILFWRAVKAYNAADYNEALEDMEKVNSAAVDAFKSYNPRLFCRCLMNTDTKVDVVVNNLAETFNGYIIVARTKHLLYMLEEIRTALMQRLAVKKNEMESYNALVCPRIAIKLEKNKKEAAECYVVPSTQTVFQVSHKMDVLHVNLESRTCTCRRWDLTGIPCSHAVACIFFCHKEAEDFVAHWYTKATYLRSYASSIPPCVGERHWPKVTFQLIPPPIKIGPGRPRKNRIKDPFEDPKKPGRLTRHGRQMTCSICKSTKHNKATCKNKDTVESQQQGSRMSFNDEGPSQHQSQTSNHLVHDATAEPSRTGRGGRVIRGGRGRGSRGRGAVGVGRSVGGSSGGRGRGASGRGRGEGGVTTRSRRGGAFTGGRTTAGGVVGRGIGGRGRGGRGRGGGRVPFGAGLFVTGDGTSFFNTPTMPTPMNLHQASNAAEYPIGSQGSTAP